MAELIIQFLREINIAQLIAIGGMFWFFYTRLNNKITDSKIELRNEAALMKSELKHEIASVKSELKHEIASVKSELKEEINKLGDKVEDVDRRLCRIEGSLAIQGHCLYSQRNQPDRKAE